MTCGKMKMKKTCLFIFLPSRWRFKFSFYFWWFSHFLLGDHSTQITHLAVVVLLCLNPKRLNDPFIVFLLMLFLLCHPMLWTVTPKKSCAVLSWTRSSPNIFLWRIKNDLSVPQTRNFHCCLCWMLHHHNFDVLPKT